MDNDKFLKLCKRKIVEYLNGRKDKTDQFEITEDDVFVAWFYKTLHHNIALLSTTVGDGMYYELTFNGIRSVLYFNVYKKWQNIRFEVDVDEDIY